VKALENLDYPRLPAIAPLK